MYNASRCYVEYTDEVCSCGKILDIWILNYIFATAKSINCMCIMEEIQIIARNIKKMREASSYTQDNIASFLGITRSAYSNYELGTRELPLECMEKLADLYGCDAYLLYEEDADVVENMLVTVFRVDNLSHNDMEQIAAFKRIVKKSLMMDSMLLK